MNSSIVTPAQPQPWKSSIFNLPKKPPRLALPGLHPFPGIDLARPFSSHILVHPGQRQWQPRSGRILGWPPSPSHLHAPGSGGLAIPAFGRGGDRPARRHAAGAVHDGRQVRLAGGDAGPGHVGDPQLVGPVGMEVVLAPLVAQQVLGRLRVNGNLEATSRRCGGNLGPNTSYAASPRFLRYCIGLT